MYIPSSTGPWHAKGTWETLTWLNRPCLLRSICFLEVQHLRGLRVRVVILKQTVARTSLWGSYQASHIPSAAAGALVCLWGTLSRPLHKHFSHFSLELLSLHATSLFSLSCSPTPRPICSVFLHPFPPPCHLSHPAQSVFQPCPCALSLGILEFQGNFYTL